MRHFPGHRGRSPKKSCDSIVTWQFLLQNHRGRAPRTLNCASIAISVVLKAFRTRNRLGACDHLFCFSLLTALNVNFLVSPFNPSRRIGYATVINLTLVAQSVAALVCESFIITKYTYRPSWKTFEGSCKNIYLQKKKTYSNGKHTALGR